jgi:hypothetical protein
LNNLHYIIGKITVAGKFSLRHGALYWTWLIVTDKHDMRWAWERFKVEVDGKLSARASLKLFMWAYQQWRKYTPSYLHNLHLKMQRYRAAA